MSRVWMPRLVLFGVLLALAAAAGLTLYTIDQARLYAETMTRRSTDLDALAALRAEVAAYEAARTLFETCPTEPPPLLPLAASLLPGAPVPERRDLTEAGTGAWQLRRHELSFDPIAAADALALAVAAGQPLRDAAGNERPGWRLSSCVIRPAPGQPGIGRVVLTLDALVRNGNR
jgi:hypothetical protein